MRVLSLAVLVAGLVACAQPAEHFTPVTAPSNLTYTTNPAVYPKGVPIAPNTPSSSGDAVNAYAVSPALPAGLSLDPTTGTIAGTPTTSTPMATYTVTATNAGGSTSVGLVITVNDAPANLTYAENPAAYTVGVAITPNTPSSAGGPVTSYAVDPALPAGLTLDATTGVITGTPTTITPAAVYTVTAANASGSTIAMLMIAVDDVSPSNLAYSTNPATYVKGTPITANTPTASGGAIVSYAVTPPLPAGLGLNTITGVITGTPTVVTAASVYTITATNSGGSTSVDLAITVNDVAPSSLVYSTNPATYTKGMMIAPNTPSSAGGAVVSYAINPPLPPGLMFDTSTGIISGTPTAITPNASYTVVATNSGGSTSAMVAIRVVDVAPSNLVYSTNPAAYTKGMAIAPNTPSSSGGAVVSYGVTPALPAGLSLDTTSGVITGTPSAITASRVYTVTATNTGGSTQAAVTIAVNDVPPSNLTYTTNPATYAKGTTITPNTPSSSGGPVVSYAIMPALPAGLSLNTSTGVISGTPSVGAAMATYTVTATNTGGSTTVGLTITVTEPALTGLTYSTNPATYFAGAPIQPNVPTATGGSVTSYAISPALPPGLTFDTSTGVISGTPTTHVPSAVYVVTAKNSASSVTASLLIGVNSGGVDGLVGTLALGDQHSCAVIDGGVQCWGNNLYGQLGDGSTTNSLVPVSVMVGPSPLSGVTMVATSANHTCAIVRGGAMCWGSNSSGQLGNNSTTDSSVPVQVVGLTTGVQALSVGETQSCAVVNGAAMCWGGNAHGQLGNNSTTGSLVPVAVTGLTSGVQAITAGSEHTCAQVNGGAMCWGDNTYGELGDNTNTDRLVPVAVYSLGTGRVQQIVAGFQHTCAIVDGAAECWGSNAHGDLGVGLNPAMSAYPLLVSGLGSGVQALAMGDGADTCAIASGAVKCWGSNAYGQIGSGLSGDALVPAQVSGLTTGGQEIAVGGLHACAIFNGGMQCWGSNQSGQYGNNSTNTSSVPVANGLATGVFAIAGGMDHTCAIVNGGVQCWGKNASGQLGNNSTTNSALPVAVANLTTGAQAIALGNDFSCALVNGGVECWGGNAHGQLGNNTTTDSMVPVAVSGLTSGVQAIAAGGWEACALVNGGVRCWGYNTVGQLGNNSTTDSPVPVQVSGLTSGVQAISVAYSGVRALVNGAVMAWGYNGNGELGNNSTTNSSVPVQVSGLTSGVQAVVAGYNHTCALVGGGLQCWGYNNYGQLGNDTVTNSLVPVPVSGMSTGVSAMTLGGAHTCATLNSGLRCWGSNYYGELGTGTFTDSHVPAPVIGFGAGTQPLMASGNRFACAMLDGLFECWGDNNSGQIGDNTIVNRSAPTTIGAFQ